jgi:nucleotide-binding universal stress UspA family protein
MDSSLLILTDFFQTANRALDYATNIARPLNARLVLLHVRRDSAIDPELFSSEISNLSQEAIDLALNSVARNLPVPVVAEVGHGRVAIAVADAVRRHHPLLVVLGRPDYSDLPDELVQTTSLDLLRTAPYPMLVVPHGIASTAPPRRVLLAVDGQPFTLGEHAGSIHHLLTALGADVTVLHVAPDTGPNELPPPLLLESVARTGLLADLPLAQYRAVVNSHAAAGILEAAQPAAYDLVVLIARQRSFMGNLFHHSVTAQVLLASKVPVLVLPAQ